MARADLIVDLVKAGVKGDTSGVRTSASAIAADERAKRHTGVADRITRVLDWQPSSNGNGQTTRPGVKVRDGSGGILRREPQRPMHELYLPKQVQQSCRELVEEQHRADVLRASGIEPRHRVLLVGPPGNGKTSLAESLAYEMALPLFIVRYDAVVTSYLGETAQRLRRLFDFVRTEPCVLFFDEFDAIGKERGDLHETGEIKRVVSTLLLQLDDLPSYCVVIGATNHPELLDRAAWRRFEIKVTLGRPTQKQMTSYMSDQLKRFDETPGYSAKRLTNEVPVDSYSDAEEFFMDIRRRWALSQGRIALRSIISDRVRAWRELRSDSMEANLDDRSSDSTTD